MLPKEAVVDASKPAVKPPGQRRFEAAEGAALQAEGELPLALALALALTLAEGAALQVGRASLQPCVREAATPCDPM